ncbi:MAG TPA: alpha/beta fold hydrolase [Croceibacterium sp.]|nr:alpha/beta fold hydrolase [Croceibacterium sp.]
MFKRGGLRTGLLPAALLALASPVPALAQAESQAAPEAPPAIIPTSAFAARSPFSSVPELSPDGTRVAYSVSQADHETIGVWDIDGEKAVNRIPLGEGQELQWFEWAGDGRLLVSVSLPSEVYNIDVRITRLFVVDLATSELSYVGPKTQGLDGDDVIFVDPAGEFVLLSVQREMFSEPQVWRFRLDGTDTEGEQIERRGGVWQWVADDKGVVRLGLGWDSGKLKVWYRKSADEPFRVVARIGRDDEDELWDVVRLISGSDEGLVLEPGDSGHLALRRFNMATREVGEIVYENPDWDLERVDLDDNGQPLAIHFTDDRERVVWLDPELARLQGRFERALGQDQVRIVDRSRDGSRMLVSKGDADDPGAWYVYTPSRRELHEFARLRPGIDPALLAPVRPVEYFARDGTKIHAYLTLPRGREAKGLPLIVMPHGGPYSVRDSLEYSDEVQLLANRGYAVLQPNFRGSGGYGKSFDELGEGEIGRRMQDDLDDAVDWAAGEGLVDPQRVCLAGSSYGGYAALWGVIRNPERYRCAASFAGVTAFDKQLAYDSNYLSGKRRRSWRDRIRGEDRSFDLDTVSPARQAELLHRPVLLVHGKEDRTVPFNQFVIMRNAIERARVAGAEFVVLEDAGHGFSTAEDEQKWYDALLAFLAKHNPAD